MGLEANCTVRLNGDESIGQAHCGDGEIDFRGDFRFRWLWKELTSITVKGDTLIVKRKGEAAELDLGEKAEKWAHAIRNPKPRLDKLGVKPESRYQAWGEFDEFFQPELTDRAGEPGDKPLDLVFVRLDEKEELPKLLEAKEQIAQNGAIWPMWPKGRKELREDDIRDFAKANGLVDVKVASFSDKLSALKLVIPVSLRK